MFHSWLHIISGLIQNFDLILDLIWARRRASVLSWWVSLLCWWNSLLYGCLSYWFNVFLTLKKRIFTFFQCYCWHVCYLLRKVHFDRNSLVYSRSILFLQLLLLLNNKLFSGIYFLHQFLFGYWNFLVSNHLKL